MSGASSSDDSAAGAGADSPLHTPAKPPAKRGRCVEAESSRAPAASEVAASSEAGAPCGDVADNDLCHLCCDVDGGPCTHTYRGVKVHGPCKNAIRSYARLLAKRQDMGAKRTNDSNFYTDKPAWRAAIRPLLVQAGSKRTCQQRGQVKMKLEEDYKATEQIRDTVYYTQPAFIAYNMFWERLTESEAVACWLQELDAASEHENSDGEPMIGVKDHPRSRRISGKRTISRSVASTAVGSGSADGCALFSPMDVYAGDASVRKRPRDTSDDDADDSGIDASPAPKLAQKMLT